MSGLIKTLRLLLIFGFALSFACDRGEQGVKEKKGGDALAFVESSNGLPSGGLWRHGIAFCDINGDGHIDILALPPRKAADRYVKPFVWYGRDDGTWSESGLDAPSDIDYDYGSIAVSDFNGDGIPDIALAMHCLGLRVLFGTKEGRYVDGSKGLPSRKDLTSRALISADLNNDGIADIAALSEAQFLKSSEVPKGVWACYRSGESWTCGPIGKEEEVRGLFGDQLAMGDVNGDGNKDIAAASLVVRRNLIVWLGDGKGGFRPFNKGLPQGKVYFGVSLADINKDGMDDLVASISGFGEKAFFGLKAFLSGQDGFEEMSDGLPSKEWFTAVNACDLDGDGTIEIIGGNSGGGIKVFSQKGGTWQERDVSGLPKTGLRRIYNIYCEDLNKDGQKDIAFNYAWEDDNSGGIRVYLNATKKGGSQGKGK
jgi:hypothetical protein